MSGALKKSYASAFNKTKEKLEARKQNKPNTCLLEILLSTLIEVSSFFDFISDFVILKALAGSTDTAWFSFALFTMICPYYTVYTSLTNFQIQQTRKKVLRGKFGCLSYFTSSLTILPTMLLLLMIMDVAFMTVSVIAYPILLIFAFFPIGQDLFDRYEHAQN